MNRQIRLFAAMMPALIFVACNSDSGPSPQNPNTHSPKHQNPQDPNPQDQKESTTSGTAGEQSTSPTTAVPNLGLLEEPCDTLKEKTDPSGPWLDPSMTTKECRGIKTIYKSMSVVGVSASPGSNFDLIFGGTDASALVKYLNDRVHYIIPGTTYLGAYLEKQWEIIPPFHGRIVAVNIGAGLWIAQKTLKAQYPSVRFAVGQTPLDIYGPNTGLIQLGTRFDTFDLIERMETIIHEARHSECESESSPRCGQPHVECPRGHELEGVSACDSQGVGPYFVGAVFSKAISETCTNCSEYQKQIAKLVATDALGRVLNLAEIQSGRENGFKINPLPGYSSASVRQDLSQVHAARKRELAIP